MSAGWLGAAPVCVTGCVFALAGVLFGFACCCRLLRVVRCVLNITLLQHYSNHASRKA